MNNPFLSIWNMLRKNKVKSLPHLRYGELQLRLAEALLWRDEAVSVAAVPEPLLKQDQETIDKYLDDADYLITSVKYSRTERATDEQA